MPRTAILYIAQRCNQRCVFCLEEEQTWSERPDPEGGEVSSLLRELRARGGEHITFMGGETFFRKDLPEIIGEAKRLGYTRVGVTTNGTVLSKRGFVANLVDAGLDFIEMSVHAHTAALAERISRSPQTFERQLRAMAEIDATGSLRTIVNVVVCRDNHRHLVDVAHHVLGALGRVPLRFKYKFVSLQGWEAQRAEAGERAPLRYEEVDFVGLGDALQARGGDYWFYNVPLCFLGRHASHAHEVSTLVADERYFDVDHRGDRGYYDSGAQLEGRVWPGCAPCRLRALCPGVEESYRRVHGLPSLAPRPDDPLPLIERALLDRGRDPATAAARREALQAAPRPEQFELAHPEGALRFVHDEGAPLDVEVDERRPDRRSWEHTERFAIGYRSAQGHDPPPHAWPLLHRALQVLREADREGLALAGARTRLLALELAGWRIDPRSEAALAPRKQGKAPPPPRAPGRRRLPLFDADAVHPPSLPPEA